MANAATSNGGLQASRRSLLCAFCPLHKHQTLSRDTHTHTHLIRRLLELYDKAPREFKDCIECLDYYT